MTAPAPEFSGHLALIAEMMREFASSQDMNATARRGLARIAAELRAEAASMFMLESNGAELVCNACYGPVDVTGLRLPATHGIVGRSIQSNSAQMVVDVDQDPDFFSSCDSRTGFRTRSVLCAPISSGDDRLGAIQIINHVDGGLFCEADRQFLEALGSSAALAILNARLTVAMIEREKMQRELELAAEIQRGLLPSFKRADSPIFAMNLPARLVSGDFYDVVERDDGRLWFNIGDVSGKGMNAALLMAKTTSLFRCLAKTIDCPGRLMALINAELCETGSHGMFVTMIGGLLDPSTGSVRLANAGHEPPLLVDRQGETVRSLPASAPPVGIAPDIVGAEGFPVDELLLDGGGLYLFTDGVTEANGAAAAGAYNGGRAMLGVDGLKRLIREYRSLPLRARIESMTASIAPTGSFLRDDLTLMLISGEACGMLISGEAHGMLISGERGTGS